MRSQIDLGLCPGSGRPEVLTAAVGRFSRVGRVGRVLGPEVDKLRIGRALLGLRRDEAAVGAWSPLVRRAVYLRIWGEAADVLGAVVEPLGPDFLMVRRGENRTVVRYHEVMLDSAVHLALALDKGIVQNLLTAAGLPVSPHTVIHADDVDAGIAFMVDARSPVVVKPLGASGGRGVTCGVDTAERFRRAVVWARRWDSHLIVERQAEGDEIRLLFLDGDLLGILRRRPTRLEGDGVSTISGLVAAENRRRGAADGALGTSAVGITLDSLFTLERQGFRLRSTPARGASIQMCSTTNQSGAADSEMLTRADVSPLLVVQAAKAVASVGLRLASVEIVTPDPSRSLCSSGGVVLEVNGTPGLHYHYLVRDPAHADRVAIPILALLLDGSSRARESLPREKP
jgi:glutathione synthase/RimK-type ligase-like ATP-grasp enzyme